MISSIPLIPLKFQNIAKIHLKHMPVHIQHTHHGCRSRLNNPGHNTIQTASISNINHIRIIEEDNFLQQTFHDSMVVSSNIYDHLYLLTFISMYINL